MTNHLISSNERDNLATDSLRICIFYILESRFSISYDHNQRISYSSALHGIYRVSRKYRVFILSLHLIVLFSEQFTRFAIRIMRFIGISFVNAIVMKSRRKKINFSSLSSFIQRIVLIFTTRLQFLSRVFTSNLFPAFLAGRPPGTINESYRLAGSCCP